MVEVIEEVEEEEDLVEEEEEEGEDLEEVIGEEDLEVEEEVVIGEEEEEVEIFRDIEENFLSFYFFLFLKNQNHSILVIFINNIISEKTIKIKIIS